MIIIATTYRNLNAHYNWINMASHCLPIVLNEKKFRLYAVRRQDGALNALDATNFVKLLSPSLIAENSAIR